MGRRGPPRIPDEVKAARGNPGDHALNDRLPDYDPAEDVEPPKDLDKAGRELWITQSRMMIQAGVLKKTDLIILHDYCKLHDDKIFQENLLRGFKRKKELGFFDFRAMLACQRQVVQLRDKMRHFAQELGLTPASRSAIKSSKKRITNTKEGNERKGSGQTGGTTARFFNKQTAGIIPGGKAGT
jgi:phage terminase small subunit